MAVGTVVPAKHSYRLSYRVTLIIDEAPGAPPSDSLGTACSVIEDLMNTDIVPKAGRACDTHTRGHRKRMEGGHVLVIESVVTSEKQYLPSRYSDGKITRPRRKRSGGNGLLNPCVRNPPPRKYIHTVPRTSSIGQTTVADNAVGNYPV
jgi:hypothetical protein